MTNFDQNYESNEDDSDNERSDTRLRPSINSSSKLTDGRDSDNIKAKIIKKPKKKKNEVAANDVILGKVDYDGSFVD
jgi:hypothetical protein